MHKNFKQSSIISNIFKTETRGCLHIMLSFIFAGSRTNFKRHFRQHLEENLDWRGYDPEAGEHLSHIESTQKSQLLKFLCGIQEDSYQTVIGASSKLRRWHSLKRLFNGSWTTRGVVQHRCVHAGCCQSRSHCIEQIQEHILDTMGFPSP